MNKTAFAWFPLLILLVGCTASRRGPDLAQIYNRSAQLHDLERNPVVVIPGLLGSKLRSEDGTEVWGLLGGEYANPKTPSGARLAALPMAEGFSLEQLRDDVRAAGVLDRLRVKLLGIPIEVAAYSEILSSLGVGGFRDEGFGLSGAVDYGEGHFTCFQFAYDWRRDIAEAARELHHYLLEKRAYVAAEMKRRYGVDDNTIRFDIVAHSMGGMVARYYLRYGAADLPEDGSSPPLTWEGAALVENLILIGTPNAGTMAALFDLVDGRNFGPSLPRYQPALLGTFPGAYQLLPRSRHEFLVTEEGGELVDGDILDPETWVRFGWGLADPEQDEVLAMLLPEAETREERRRIALDHLEKSLTRARAFTAAMDLPGSPPPWVRIHLLAGDAIATDAVVAVQEGSGELTVVEKQPGDGAVLRRSALMDERKPQELVRRLVSPIDWSNVTFLSTGHLGLTKDPSFTDNVLYLLLESPR
ncbi:MAG: hypothetical protein K0U98_22315 [Deltaproteobacteria bacterium]|nr:hypothetical protein [Deltaproteobacteria bacterium]